MLIDEEDAASAVDSEFDCVVVGAAASVAVGSGVFEAERRENFLPQWKYQRCPTSNRNGFNFLKTLE